MDVEDIEQYLGYMNQYLSTIDSDTSAMRTTLTGINNHLVDIKGYYYYYENKELDYLKAFSNLLARAQSASGSDALAGNPWWATNSGFASVWDDWSSTLPYPPGHRTSMSFPEAFSYFLSTRSRLVSVQNPPQSELWNGWGYNSQNRSENGVWSFEDWLAYAMKSNMFLQASLVREGWTNDYENIAWVLNHFDYAMGDVTNLLGSMVAASDPWWSTNSAFAMTYPALSFVAPQLLPGNGDGQPGIQSFISKGMSFPEYMSFRAAMENRGASDIFGQASQDAQTWFGAPDFEHWEDALNYRRQATFTFEDWLATMLNTNLALTMGTFANSYSNLIADAAAHGYSDYSQPTNVPLPEYQDLISEAQSSAASTELQAAQQKMESTVESLSGMIGTPNSEITVIPEFSVGGIHVDEQKFDFDNDVARAARRICNFLYYVMLFAASFSLLQSEWAYYVNMGRSWIENDYFQ